MVMKVAGALALILGSLPTHAASAADSLPGGANSLREVYQDWVVACSLPRKSDAVPLPAVSCAISQELIQQNTKRRVLALAVSPTADGGAKGNLLMPFGLALAKGVQLQIDEGQQTSPIAFRTCTAQGCVVPLDWSSASVGGLNAGGVLKVTGTGDNGQPANFTLSLKGFSAGIARAAELQK